MRCFTISSKFCVVSSVMSGAVTEIEHHQDVKVSHLFQRHLTTCNVLVCIYLLLYFTDKTEQFKTFTKVFFLWVEIKCVITFQLFATLHYFILSKYVLQKIHRGDRKHDSYKIMILRILIQSQGIKGFEGSKKSHWTHCASF